MNSEEQLVREARARGGPLAFVAEQIADTSAQIKMLPAGSKSENLLKAMQVAMLSSLTLSLALRKELDEHKRVLDLNLKNFNDLSEHLMLARADQNDAIDRQLKRHGLINEDT